MSLSSVDLPVGTVTFLFTDIEGSTRILRRLGRDRYGDVLAFHNALVRRALAEHDGVEVARQGDGFFAVFTTASDAVRAATDVQRSVAAAEWPHDADVRVRIGVHTGEAQLGSEGYVGLSVHEASRVGDSGDGGHVLLSSATAALVADDLDETVALQDIGTWRLEGFEGDRRLFALTLGDGIAPVDVPTRLRFAEDPQRPLLERSAELAAIEALFEEPQLERPRFLAVEGRAGIGKTRLAAAAREAAEREGLQVLAARGAELEQDFGYGVVRQLFEPLVANLDADEQAELLSGAAGLAARLFDESELAAALAGGNDVGFGMLHGLYWFAANVALKRPTLLAIDDLHWADASTLRWLCYLLPRLEGLPLVLVVASRPAEQARETSLVTQILTDPSALVVRPGPLTAGSVATLVRAVLRAEPDDAFVDACCAATGGNPLLLRAVLDAIADEGGAPTAEAAARVHEIGPQAVSRVVHLRLARLGGDATALAESIAVLGEDADAESAGAHAGLERAAAEAAALGLERADLIRLERPLRFGHPVVRAAVYEQISAATRPSAHRAAAALLAARGATPERIATHLLLTDGEGDPAVVETLRTAARRMLAQGVADAAVAYLRRALDEPPPTDDRASVLFELGSAELRVDGVAAAHHLREAAEAETDVVRRVQCLVEYARALWYTADHEPAIDVLQAAIGELGDEERDLREQLVAELISSAWWEPQYLPIALEQLEQIRPDELGDGLGSKQLLANFAFMTARRGVERERALEYARRALEGGVLQRSTNVAFQYAALTLVMAEQFDEALETYDAALAEACRRGDIVTEAGVLMFRGFTNTRLGRLGAALDDLRRCVGVARAAEIETTYPYATAFLCEALLETGDIDAAAEALGLLPVPDDLASSGHFFFYVTARGTLRMAQGRREEGLRDLLSLGSAVSRLHQGSTAWGRWRGRAVRALLEAGEREHALELAREDFEAASRWGAPRAVALALVARGLAEGGDRGVELFREALDVAEQSPALTARVRVLLELGSALRRRNQRAEAREFLRRALELATECGAGALVARARAELEAAGAKPRTTALSGAESLTASEARVAQLAADGMSNREIAQSLFVTPKTVEVHLTSAYRKLEIASRTQLAEALSGERDG